MKSAPFATRTTKTLPQTRKGSLASGVCGLGLRGPLAVRQQVLVAALLGQSRKVGLQLGVTGRYRLQPNDVEMKARVKSALLADVRAHVNHPRGLPQEPVVRVQRARCVHPAYPAH